MVIEFSRRLGLLVGCNRTEIMIALPSTRVLEVVRALKLLYPTILTEGSEVVVFNRDRQEVDYDDNLSRDETIFVDVVFGT